MTRPSSLSLAKPQIVVYFAKGGPRLYTKAELGNLLINEGHRWRLVKSTTLNDFISFLMKHSVLKTLEFQADAYDRRIIRYAWGPVSPYATASSLKAGGYLSHGTAANLHNLGTYKPKTIYLNVEQSPKPSPDGNLTQTALERAFAGKQRQSNYVFRQGSHSVTIIAGKNTGRLGVENLKDTQGVSLDVTNLERTLIDITVRPAYAGGINEVLKAYRSARNRVSVARILNILDELAYIYPYHQAIGFLMQAAGYGINETLLARPREHDFYLTHGMQAPRYCEKWRLYYPSDLKIPRRGEHRGHR